MNASDSKQRDLSISLWLLCLWAFLTCCLIGLSLVLYVDNQEIKAVPVFIYAGPNVPQDIIEKINSSMENFDEKTIEAWYSDRVYDKDFQMAMFYSYLSIAMAEKASINKKDFQDAFKRDLAFQKSTRLWLLVVKKDGDLRVFRDYFMNRYIKVVKSN